MQDKPESDPYRYYLMGFIGSLTGQVPSPDDVLAVARVQGTACLRAFALGTAHGKRCPEPCSPEQVAALLAPEADTPKQARRADDIRAEIEFAMHRITADQDVKEPNAFMWTRAAAKVIAEQIARLERLLLPAAE